MYYEKNGRAQGTDTGVRASVDVNFFMRCTIQSLKATTGKNEPRPAKAPASCPTERTIAQILKAQVLSGRSIAACLWPYKLYGDWRQRIMAKLVARMAETPR